MKKLMLLVPFLCMVPVAAGKVSTRVCFADGNTPFLPVDTNLPIIRYPEIMVGTELTIIVDSNVAQDWSGCLIIKDDHRNHGILSARDPLLFGDWSGSHWEAAGENALVNDREEPGIDGFSLYTDWSLNNIEAGDWFVIDYNAANIGECGVVFYQYDPPFGDDILVNYLVFTHVRSRDFDKSTQVDLGDFAILASYWQGADCNDPDWCGGADLDTDEDVDFDDVMLFTDYWLTKTDNRCQH